MGDKSTFLKNFIKNPRQIGSVIPSSKRLSKKMVESIDFENAKTIVELGPGVGPYTELILKEKKDFTNYIAFEKNEDMRRILASKFGDITICDDAEKLSQTLKNNSLGPVDYIVSGLPFTVLEKKSRESILEQVYTELKPNGKFITYQYSFDLYKYLKNKYSNVEIKVVPINIPIAFVYVCTK